MTWKTGTYGDPWILPFLHPQQASSRHLTTRINRAFPWASESHTLAEYGQWDYSIHKSWPMGLQHTSPGEFDETCPQESCSLPPASPFLTNLSEMYRCDLGARSHPGPLVTQGWKWHQWVRKPNKPVLTPEGFSLLGLPQGTQMWTRTHARTPHVGYPDKTVFSSYLKVIPNKESWTKSLWKVFFFLSFWVLDGMGVGVCALPKEWLVTL